LSLARWTWLAVAVQLLCVEFVSMARGDELLTGALRSATSRWMIWPAVFGALCGHFFGDKGAPQYAWVVLVPMTAAVLWHDIFIRSVVPPHSYLELFLLFLGVGAFCWGSR
jgi:hypothetical protein